MKLVLLALVASFGSGSALKPVSRRALGAGVASGVAGLAAPKVAVGAGATTVFVAGATGQTGRRVLERLVARSDVAPSAGVRNVDKAKKTRRGDGGPRAMVQQVSAVDATGVDFKKLDVVGDDVATMAAALKGSSALVIATGFVPGNPLKMDSAAHAVDNLGTVALVDAAKAAGVKKVVLVSSILTNGRVVLGVDAPVRNRVILFEDGATIEVKFHGRDSAGGLSAPLPFADCDEALFAVDHAMSMKFNHAGEAKALQRRADRRKSKQLKDITNSQ
ncbi:divinyl chlorophyllide a 8-vinyl-reductase [Aureococcus anophagefferens]|nr:divinyl chlorophyllide a 8-vinyl-reductase [Aureococcus anophagefferens]